MRQELRVSLQYFSFSIGQSSSHLFPFSNLPTRCWQEDIVWYSTVEEEESTGGGTKEEEAMAVRVNSYPAKSKPVASG